MSTIAGYIKTEEGTRCVSWGQRDWSKSSGQTWIAESGPVGRAGTLAELLEGILCGYELRESTKYGLADKPVSRQCIEGESTGEVSRGSGFVKVVRFRVAEPDEAPEDATRFALMDSVTVMEPAQRRRVRVRVARIQRAQPAVLETDDFSYGV